MRFAVQTYIAMYTKHKNEPGAADDESYPH